nr:MAG TPA: hypothetical protein [Caudoviricetes sp.]
MLNTFSILQIFGTSGKDFPLSQFDHVSNETPTAFAASFCDQFLFARRAFSVNIFHHLNFC